MKTTVERAPIYVTEPTLPNLSKYVESLQKIWDKKWLTNNGDFAQRLEKELCEYLDVPFVSLVSNGTLGLMNAIYAMELEGEVITTPFSFVATTHCIEFGNLKPVFCDIDPETLNIDCDKIEQHIGPNTKAIMAVHVYGNPCDNARIAAIAKKHNLKVIYDAAHAFGVRENGKTILNYGDMSVLSFHATKVFNTVEGGAVVTEDPEMKKKLDYLRNFGFANETTIVMPGINAKMNELQAAFGLLQLENIDAGILARKTCADYYRERLVDIPGIKIFPDWENVRHNYSYFPVLISETEFGKSRDELYEALKPFNIFARRYFYPLISSFSPYAHLPTSTLENLPVANKVADTVLCLPMFTTLTTETIDYIIEKITEVGGAA